MPLRSLSERQLTKAKPLSLPHSTAVTDFWGKGLNDRNPSPGMGRHILSKFPHDAGLPNLSCWGEISESTITSLWDPRDDKAFARGYCCLLVGLEITCDGDARLTVNVLLNKYYYSYSIY